MLNAIQMAQIIFMKKNRIASQIKLWYELRSATNHLIYFRVPFFLLVCPLSRIYIRLQQYHSLLH